MAGALLLLSTVVVWSDGLQPLLYALMSLVSLFGVVYAARLHVDRLHHYHLKHSTRYGATILYVVALGLLLLGAVFTSFTWLALDFVVAVNYNKFSHFA
jgi:hypothetical protein